MKRIGGLFEQIGQRDTLSAALWAATRHKRKSAEALEFLTHADERLADMGDALRSGQYRFSHYRSFSVRDTKTRDIHAPCFQDRVAHHAIIRVTGPVFEHSAMLHSYACIAQRGQHRALQQLRIWLRRSHWYGKVDVRKFYDSVNHAILMELLARRFREQRLLTLFEALLNSWCCRPGCGIPIGALTSQWLGNFYLDEVDRRLAAMGIVPRYMRYMDDMLLLGTRQQLNRARPALLDILAQLELEAKNGGEWNRAAQGIPWLGFTVYPDRVRVNPNGRRRLRRKLFTLTRHYCEGRLDEYDFQARAQALFAHAKHADDANWRRGVLARYDTEG